MKTYTTGSHRGDKGIADLDRNYPQWTIEQVVNLKSGEIVRIGKAIVYLTPDFHLFENPAQAEKRITNSDLHTTSHPLVTNILIDTSQKNSASDTLKKITLLCYC